MTQVINYITTEQLAATMNITGGTVNARPHQADLAAAVAAASRAVDGICQRQFGGGTANETRYYSPEQRLELEIDDLQTFVSLATDSNGDGTFATLWAEGVDMELEPLNAAADGWPWTRIRVRRNGANLFPCFVKAAEVTGTFGWAAIPDDIINATSLLATRIYQLSVNAPLDVIPGGVEGMIRLGSRIPNVMLLLGPYQRHKISVA